MTLFLRSRRQRRQELRRLRYPAVNPAHCWRQSWISSLFEAVWDTVAAVILLERPPSWSTGTLHPPTITLTVSSLIFDVHSRRLRRLCYYKPALSPRKLLHTTSFQKISSFVRKTASLSNQSSAYGVSPNLNEPLVASSPLDQIQL